MPTKWYEGKIISMEDASPTVRRFFLEVEDVDEFDFKPGQFITIDLPISEKRLGRWRSYSIANEPGDNNILELCIVKLEGGSGTDYLFNEIGEGDKLKFKGPDGMFVFPKDLEREIVFLCTGTGVAPFRSMLKHIYKHHLPHQNMHLIYGTRYNTGILYEEEFLEMARMDKKFIYDVTLSREDKIKSPHHSKGYIHPIYMEKYKDVDPNRLFLICGWSDMIDEAVANLIINLGYDKTQVKYELYG